MDEFNILMFIFVYVLFSYYHCTSPTSLMDMIIRIRPVLSRGLRRAAERRDIYIYAYKVYVYKYTCRYIHINICTYIHTNVHI
jgi:hypothetical protein